MEKFGKDNKCVKCGHRVFLEADEKCLLAKKLMYVPEVKTEEMVGKEHLMITCGRCEYKWAVACIDAA